MDLRRCRNALRIRGCWRCLVPIADTLTTGLSNTTRRNWILKRRYFCSREVRGLSADLDWRRKRLATLATRFRNTNGRLRLSRVHPVIYFWHRRSILIGKPKRLRAAVHDTLARVRE